MFTNKSNWDIQEEYYIFISIGMVINQLMYQVEL